MTFFPNAFFVWSTMMNLMFIVGRCQFVKFEGPNLVEAGGIHNIHLTYVVPINGTLSLHYGRCDIKYPGNAHYRIGITLVGNHPLASRHADWEDQLPTRFVWIVPSNLAENGCLHAFSGNALVGTSAPIKMLKRTVRKRARTALGDISDTEGPWFDGVEYLKAKEPEASFVAQSKAKTVGIIGAGISGLMTSLLLEGAGIHNWRIIEASNNTGGRIRTRYFNGTTPEEYQYQEMGAMRFPVGVKHAGTNETLPFFDHQMVSQLADKLNLMNGNDPSLIIQFINWINRSANQPTPVSWRRPDGTVPGTAEVAENASLTIHTGGFVQKCSMKALAEAKGAYNEWIGLDKSKMESIAANIFAAHRKAVDEGLFDFSESGYMRYILNVEPDIADRVDSIADSEPSWLYDRLYFSATEWQTIDKGVSRLPAAFDPLVAGKTQLNTAVQQLEWDDTREKMTVKWRAKGALSLEIEVAEFDYVVVSVPFSKVRLWKLPVYSSLLSRAINTLNYKQACKVSLHYQTRFWEHLEHPIFGGCGSTDIPGIGMICYPSFQINASGPGAILASYQIGNLARSLGSMTEEEHVALAQRAMIEVHGDAAREQYTGHSDRICWENDEYAAGAYAAPLTGQQQLYLPAYFQTEKNTVFVGEHTSYTHAWIWSALESAVRGTVQLLLEMGLVDEAKGITEQWMARWISV